MSKSDLKLRSGQLIVPFGIGQIVPNKEGLSMMIGGLNLWDKMLEQRKVEGVKLNPDDFEIYDDRLQKLLKVKKFIKPFPYYERSTENKKLKLPAVVFPLWHYCNYCKIMREMTLTGVDSYCIEEKCMGKMIPVRFIAACDAGHIQDIPFKEWAHKDGIMCDAPKLKYSASAGSGSLSDIFIKCLNCEEKASLSGLLNVSRSEDNGLVYSSALDSVLEIKCSGHKPWIGQEGINNADPCENHLQAIISGGSNVHYADISSALVLPAFNEKERLNELLKPQNIESIESLMFSQPDDIVKSILNNLECVSSNLINADDLFQRINSFLNEGDDDTYNDTQIRFEEFNFFKKDNNSQELKSTVQLIKGTADDIFDGLIKNIGLVEKLKEIRVFSGFTRLNSRNMSNSEERKEFLTNKRPDWLPAYEHYGEGIFIEFDLDRLNEINSKIDKHPRIKNYNEAQLRRDPQNYIERDIDNCFISIHTLSHILIRRLCFSCGYGSSSLRERLYYSTDQNTRMAGLLIYTASGDSEGSLGGLVNQGEISNFKKLFEETLIEAQWCSSDPVCSDIGEEIGQGPNNVNGAACHNCCIVPETSCEEFNTLLDRNILLKVFQNLID
jgi:hypothetical protein